MRCCQLEGDGKSPELDYWSACLPTLCLEFHSSYNAVISRVGLENARHRPFARGRVFVCDEDQFSNCDIRREVETLAPGVEDSQVLSLPTLSEVSNERLEISIALVRILGDCEFVRFASRKDREEVVLESQ